MVTCVFNLAIFYFANWTFQVFNHFTNYKAKFNLKIKELAQSTKY